MKNRLREWLMLLVAETEGGQALAQESSDKCPKELEGVIAAERRDVYSYAIASSHLRFADELRRP